MKKVSARERVWVREIIVDAKCVQTRGLGVSYVH